MARRGPKRRNHDACCPNPDCLEHRKVNSGKVVRNGHKSNGKQNFLCHGCGSQFVETRGTVLENLKHPIETFGKVTALYGLGMEIWKLAMVFEVKEETVRKWNQRAETATQKFLDEKLQNLKVSALQLDEMYSYVQNKKNQAYIWQAIDPVSKLLFPPMVSKSVDEVNARKFVRNVQKRIARPEFVSLVSTDGEDSYVDPVKRAFKSACFVQVVKKRKGYKLESISSRVLTGESMDYVNALFKKLGIGSKPNTSFVERVNGTTRSMCSDFLREGVRRRGPKNRRVGLMELAQAL